MKDYSQILLNAYDKFILTLGDKKIPTPYRRNEKGSFQKVEPIFQGKSAPESLTEKAIELAKKNFNLEKASVEEIKKFMEKNKLGIDCSGFLYRMLNELALEINNKPLTSLGFEHVGRTNVVKFRLPEHSKKIGLNEARPGDFIVLNSKNYDEGDVLHAVIILKVEEKKIIYAHSSGVTSPSGVHLDEIVNGKFPPDLKHFSYDPDKGDGVQRLKALS